MPGQSLNRTEDFSLCSAKRDIESDEQHLICKVPMAYSITPVLSQHVQYKSERFSLQVGESAGKLAETLRRDSNYSHLFNECSMTIR